MGIVGNIDFMKESDMLETLVFTQKSYPEYAWVLDGWYFIAYQLQNKSDFLFMVLN